ncbi:hypothetical protein D5S17_21375 [Pseudonocardiaceae bacterium YIM PH 21723]|nr:hypothetical protein D5S17_21375 [Pseudonocardiaceae bacterium YIM PH 21723]
MGGLLELATGHPFPAGVLGGTAVVSGVVLLVSAMAGTLPRAVVALAGVLLVVFGLIALPGGWVTAASGIVAGLVVTGLPFFAGNTETGLNEQQQERIEQRIDQINPELTEAEHAMAEGEANPQQERLVRSDAQERAKQERDRAYRHATDDSAR